MLEKEANEFLSEILKNHGIETRVDDEFVHADIAGSTKFKCTINYEEINSGFNSRLDVTIIVSTGEQIIECFGDFAGTITEAITQNFDNFCRSDLHVLLGAFDPENYKHSEQIDRDEWHINGKNWDVYIGNIVSKAVHGKTPPAEVATQFYNTIENTIKEQSLTNKMHWFRSYYGQIKDTISLQEFLFDNEPLPGAETLFSNQPLIQENVLCSCRNFIILKQKEKIKPVAAKKLFGFFTKKKNSNTR